MVLINKDLRPIDTTLFVNKLDALLERLRLQYETGTFTTQEEVVAEFLRLISLFYESLRQPFLTLRPARKGTPPVPADYNDLFGEVDTDLRIAFTELETLEQLILRNFNYMVSESDKINKLLKRVSSKVGDYTLYSEDPIGDLFYFKDSFNDVSKIDFGSLLLKDPQCEINQTEGIITLPAIRDGLPTTKKAQVRVNDNSNGSLGNMHQIGSARHDDIRDILDGNPDTWVEYERVERYRDNVIEPLQLDLTIYFDKPEIINFIRINPNNFGTQTPVQIKYINTSYDGSTWISIKDDIPISDFLQEDEENIFTLAPSTSKYAGQGVFTFTPRKVKYVRILLEQSTPYLIETTSGQQWRYAIGIRDIEIQAVKYLNKGDLISLPFYSPIEIQKITLLASENPTEASELADIKHQVSPDDGASWYDIQPRGRSGTILPEIINLNTSDNGAIQTATPVYSVRHRLILSRNTDKFKEGSSTFNRTIKRGMDILAVPSVSPMKLSLTRPPVDGTVILYNPLWGSRTNPANISACRLILGLSNGQSGVRFSLPKEIAEKLRSRLPTTDLQVWVDDDASWVHAATFAADQKRYTITLTEEEAFIQFGDGAGTGSTPAGGAQIGITLAPEQVYPSGSTPHLCDLLFDSDGDKENFRLYRYAAQESVTNVRIIPGATIHRMPHKNLDPTLDGGSPEYLTITDNSDPAFETFIEGGDPTNLDADGEYTIDFLNGIIYTYTASLASTTAVVAYIYTPVVELPSSQWDFVPGCTNRISIREGYAELEKSGQSLGTGSNRRYVNIGYKGIVPGSITGISSSTFDGSPAPKEVAFIDGREEFPDPDDVETDSSGYYSVDYNNGKLYLAPAAKLVNSPSAISFRYTQIFAEYTISKKLDDSSYTVDVPSSSISINERESLKIWGSRQASAKRESLLKAIYDYVETTRESIAELEPYFTPIVREYVLKILPKGVV